MALGNFSATVDEWCREKGKNRLLKIAQLATQRVASKATQRIPIDLGFARASIRASTQAMPSIDPNFDNKARATVPFDIGDITLTIANMQLGQTCWIGWTANYVGFLEGGSSKQAPSGFVRITAMEWPQIVSEVVAEAKARVG